MVFLVWPSMGAVGAGELSPLRGRGEAGLGVGVGWSTARGAGAAVSFPHPSGTASRSHVWRGADGYHKAPSSSLPPFSSPSPAMGKIKGMTHGVGTPRAAQAGLGGCCSPGRPRAGSLGPGTATGWWQPPPLQPRWVAGEATPARMVHPLGAGRATRGTSGQREMWVLVG